LIRTRFVSGTRGGGIYIFDEDGEILYQSQVSKLVRDVALSATGELIVAGSEDGYVYGFQLDTVSRPYGQDP